MKRRRGLFNEDRVEKGLVVVEHERNSLELVNEDERQETALEKGKKVLNHKAI